MEYVFLIILIVFAFLGPKLISSKIKKEKQIKKEKEKFSMPPYYKIYLPWDINKQLDEQNRRRKKFLDDLDREFR